MNGDRGAMTALAAVLSLALPALLWFAVQLGAAALTRHRAEGAADLAALAAAAHAARGQQAACARAQQVAEAMNSKLADCRTNDHHARVQVTAQAPPLLTPTRTTKAKAHAGPTP